MPSFFKQIVSVLCGKSNVIAPSPVAPVSPLAPAAINGTDCESNWLPLALVFLILQTTEETLVPLAIV